MAHRIIVVMEGGVIQDISNIPAGVEIEVRDFDVEGIVDDDLEQTEDGEEYLSSVWSEGDAE